MTGVDASVTFHVPGRLPGLRKQILRAEDGSYNNSTWHTRRLWNGDQTDRGLTFRGVPAVVRVRSGTF